MSSKQYDVLVIGAGASGLMTAYMAAQRGRKVVVVEKANKVGKKILSLAVVNVISPIWKSNRAIIFHTIHIL